jgi:two-component system, cell cycle response regulator
VPILEAVPQDAPRAASLADAVQHDGRDGRQALRATQLALFLPLGIVAFAIIVHILGVAFGPLEGFMDRWSFLVLEAGAAVACVARTVLVREERRAWAMLSVAVGLWALGDAYYRAVLYESETPPIPSVADGFWLAFYPFAYAGIALLIRTRARDVPATVWIDGLIAALAVAALGAAVVFNAVLAGIGGEPLETATGLAYPLMDMLLLAFVAAAFAITGWRLDRTWMWLAAGMAVFAVADSIYLYQVARGTYTIGGLLDAGWGIGLLFIGLAAWRFGSGPRQARRAATWRSIVLPILFGVLAVGIETYDHFTRVTILALALATTCLLAVLCRLAITFAQHVSMLHVSREEAATDPLTGLANRRQLALDLDEALAGPDAREGSVLILFDLNGFKLYNDTFGHPAGDALLTRLGARLQARVEGEGTSYRMGGDEFCVLFSRNEPAAVVVPSIAAALCERGEAFYIDCSFGWAELPEEAGDAQAALRLVDQRMYAQKQGGRASAQAQSKDVLLQALVERSPSLGPHLSDVADMAEATARVLGLSGTELEQIRVAGELHDIGKVAIPDAILDKPGPLEADEWEYVKRHSAVGERIVAAAPALAEVAKLVRCIHERFDGTGYPDRVAGDAIPLGARVIAVCDAYDAMTNDRPYRLTMSTSSAVAELRRNAGTQFDPEIVRAFCLARERHLTAGKGPAVVPLLPAALAH